MANGGVEAGNQGKGEWKQQAEHRHRGSGSGRPDGQGCSARILCHF
jgi:hypothetical protein